ncbi:hypothetical protein GCM10009740_35470 [Terrabacter terrae]|uniref:Uncharacterized protein n=1 Tax=Terrabacter terrae TaxID=318434 RepID=A0ABN2UKT1_9MICO
MQRYDIVIDGELTADLLDPALPLRRRKSGRATVVSVDAVDAGVLGRALALLESLGIGVTAIHKVEDASGGGGAEDAGGAEDIEDVEDIAGIGDAEGIDAEGIDAEGIDAEGITEAQQIPGPRGQ